MNESKTILICDDKQNILEVLNDFFDSKEFKVILSELPDKRVMGAQHRYFQSEFKKLDKWFGRYQEIWDVYFALKIE